MGRGEREGRGLPARTPTVSRWPRAGAVDTRRRARRAHCAHTDTHTYSRADTCTQADCVVRVPPDPGATIARAACAENRRETVRQQFVCFDWQQKVNRCGDECSARAPAPARRRPLGLQWQCPQCRAPPCNQVTCIACIRAPRALPRVAARTSCTAASYKPAPAPSAAPAQKD